MTRVKSWNSFACPETIRGRRSLRIEPRVTVRGLPLLSLTCESTVQSAVGDRRCGGNAPLEIPLNIRRSLIGEAAFSCAVGRTADRQRPNLSPFS